MPAVYTAIVRPLLYRDHNCTFHGAPRCSLSSFKFTENINPPSPARIQGLTRVQGFCSCCTIRQPSCRQNYAPFLSTRIFGGCGGWRRCPREHGSSRRQALCPPLPASLPGCWTLPETGGLEERRTRDEGPAEATSVWWWLGGASVEVATAPVVAVVATLESQPKQNCH